MNERGAERLDILARTLIESRRPRAKSLIVTVFGDSLAPRRSAVWLGSLIRALQPFGISDRLVRTAVLRLVREGWLVAERQGRRSFYRQAPVGQLQYEDAQLRIYAAAPPAWDGTWTMVLLGGERRRALALQGFGALGAELMLRPGADREALAHALGGQGIVLEARATDSEAMGRLVERCWDLERLAGEYRDFVGRFAPALDVTVGAAPETAFLLRVLAVHEWRRILLRDPELPAELLGRDWPGERARRLMAALYRRLAEPADAWIAQSFEAREGALPPPGPGYYTRFGGRPGRPDQE